MIRQHNPINNILEHIRDIYYKNEFNNRRALLTEHGLLTNQPSDHNFGIIYRKIREVKSLEGPVKYEQLHDSLKDKAQSIIDSGESFEYDMHKIRNFLSVLLRQANTLESIEPYIPSTFMEFIKPVHIYRHNPGFTSEDIETTFKEELTLIKRYYLLSKIHTME